MGKTENEKKEITVSFSSEYPLYDLKKNNICCNLHLTAPTLDDDKGEKRPPIDLIAVVDRSGSMSGSKLNLVIETLEFLIDELGEKDRFGVVDYGSDVKLVFPLTAMSKDAKPKAIERVKSIKSAGCTNLSGGLLKGLQQMKERLTSNEISSVLLFTDGLANEGITDTFGIVNMMKGRKPIFGKKKVGETEKQRVERQRDILVKTIKYDVKSSIDEVKKKKEEEERKKKEEEDKKKELNMQQQQAPPQINPFMQQRNAFPYRQQRIPVRPLRKQKKPKKMNVPTEKVSFDFTGITTVNTFGFGNDVDAEMLKDISKSGNGLYYFISNKEQIPEAFVNCIGGLCSVVAKKLVLNVKAKGSSKILDVFTDYSKRVIKEGEEYEILLPDLQAEEKRDIFLVAEIEESKEENKKHEVIEVNLKYVDTLGKKEVSENKIVGVIGRVGEPGKLDINHALDEVRNRILCTNAMMLANQYATEDNFGNARKMCQDTIDIIKSSPSGSKETSKEYVDDLQDTLKSLQDKNNYFRGGQQQVLNMWGGHSHQRVANFSKSSQMKYSNVNRSRMMYRMKSKMSKKK